MNHFLHFRLKVLFSFPERHRSTSPEILQNGMQESFEGSRTTLEQNTRQYGTVVKRSGKYVYTVACSLESPLTLMALMIKRKFSESINE